MIASTRELGLGEEHDGILLLSSLGLDPEVGTDALALLGPRRRRRRDQRHARPRLRVLASAASPASTRTPRAPPSATRPLALEPRRRPTASAVDASTTTRPIRGRAGVAVFVTRVVRGVDASRPTPPWMVVPADASPASARSRSSVDITNYVMLELGQPHPRLRPRPAAAAASSCAAPPPGETLVTLDGQVRTLHVEDLVIADDAGPVGLAGVMGGARTEIGAGTTACSSRPRTSTRCRSPAPPAGTSCRARRPSASSAASTPPVAAAAAAARRRSCSSSSPAAPPTRSGRSSTSHAALAADRAARGYPRASSASTTPRTRCVDALVDDRRRASRRATAARSSRRRPGAPTSPTSADLVEEVARIVGYDRIPSVLPVAPPGRGLTREQRLRRQVAIVARRERARPRSWPTPFVSSAQNARFGAVDGASDGPGRAPREPARRRGARSSARSLLPGLARHRAPQPVARTHRPRALRDRHGLPAGRRRVVRHAERARRAPRARRRACSPRSTPSIPPQPRHVAVLVLGDAVDRSSPGRPPRRVGLADALDAVRAARRAPSACRDRVPAGRAPVPAPRPHGRRPRCAGDGRRRAPASCCPRSPPSSTCPRVVARRRGRPRPLVARARRRRRAHAADLVLPAATQDLSLVVAARRPGGRRARTPSSRARASCSRPPGSSTTTAAPACPTDSKSLTFALRFRAPDRTLTAAEATEAEAGRPSGSRRATRGAALRD